MIPYLRFETLKIHNLLGGGTYLSGLHMGVAPLPPPPPPNPKGIRTCVDFQTFLSYLLLIWSNISNILQS